MSKILLLDIETSPVSAYVWQSSVHKAYVSNEQIIEDTQILSYGAKWLGKKKLYYDDLSGRLKTGEKAMLKGLWALLNEADTIVAHNGQAFDIPTILARFAAFDINPPSPSYHVDTCLEARKNLKFTSNKLEFLGRALNCPVKKGLHKNFPGMSLWKECLKDNPKAWAEMKAYNIDDVRVLEWVYLKLRPWMKNHPNVAWLAGKNGCPTCGEYRLQRRGTTRTKTMEYARYCCTACGSWTKDTVSEKHDDGKKKTAYKWRPR